jgi:hypothetical protein
MLRTRTLSILRGEQLRDDETQSFGELWRNGVTNLAFDLTVSASELVIERERL